MVHFQQQLSANSFKKQVTLAALKHSTENIGDDIQRLGLETLLPKDVFWIDRENRKVLENLKPTDKLIVYGWFIKNRHQWYGNITAQTLYIGFYIDNTINIHGTIGCRDSYTNALFKNSYVSYCVSLLNEGGNTTNRNGVILCDVKNESKMHIPEEIVQNAKTVTHRINYTMTFSDRNTNARELLKIYSEAELVITSRLHAMLPCLAFGTPVVFTNRDFEPWRASGYENMYWTLEDCPWSFGAPDRHNPWINIPPKVSREYVLGMTRNIRETVARFIQR